MRKLNAWIMIIVFCGLGITMLYFYFFPTVAKESELIFINGTIRKTEIIKGWTDENFIYLNEFKNRFKETYFSKRKFKLYSVEGDSVSLQIKKTDLKKMISNSSIKIWSFKKKDIVLYSAKQEIERQSFYLRYVLPVFAILLITASILIFKYRNKTFFRKIN